MFPVDLDAVAAEIRRPGHCRDWSIKCSPLSFGDRSWLIADTVLPTWMLTNDEICFLKCAKFPQTYFFFFFDPTPNLFFLLKIKLCLLPSSGSWPDLKMHFFSLVVGKTGNLYWLCFLNHLLRRSWLFQPVSVGPASLCQILPAADMSGDQKVAQACQAVKWSSLWWRQQRRNRIGDTKFFCTQKTKTKPKKQGACVIKSFRKHQATPKTAFGVFLSFLMYPNTNTKSFMPS